MVSEQYSYTNKPLCLLGYSNKNRAHKNGNISSYIVQHIRTNEAGLVPSMHKQTNRRRSQQMERQITKSGEFTRLPSAACCR